MDGSLPPPPPPPEVDPNSSSSLSTLTLVLISVVASIFLIFIFRRILPLLFSATRRSSSSVAPASLLVRSNSSSGATPAVALAVTSPSDLSDKKKSELIDSLPLFKLGSPLAALSKSSPDCAVCLRSFRPGEDLRLLPACCHAFHSACVETWIRSSPSCPLCRSTVTLPQPPLPPSEPPSADPLPVKERAEVEEQRSPPLPPPLPSPPRRLMYTSELSSFDDHPPEEDIEAAVPRIQWRPEADSAADTVPPPPPGDEVATAAGGDSSSRGWLRDYMERVMSSSRSSSFRSTSSSFRFSSGWLHGYEEHGVGEQYVVDLELNAWGEGEADGGGLAVALYRWIAGI